MRLSTFLIVGALALAIASPAAAGIACQPGFFGPFGADPCTPCPAGTFAASVGSEVCDDCPAGTFSLPGSAACSPCPAGSYASTTGSAACSPCPEGFIAPVPGSASCQPCPPGYTSDETHTQCIELPTPALPTTWGRLKITYR